MQPLDAAAVRTHASSLRVSLNPGQATQLLDFVALLQHWNATYNLTAIRDPEAMWTQHVLDCLAAVPSVQATLPTTRRGRILDVGSGGGLPGLVWAIALPEADLVCVDAVGKKAAFVRQAAGKLSLTNVQSVHARVESLRESPFDLISSRAFASLPDFVRLTRPLLAPGGQWVAMKGKTPTDELQALGLPSTMFHVEPLQVPGLEANRCLVWLKNDT